MTGNSELTFKTATEDWEFELIHRLNYHTFVGEIPQHTPNPEQRLVDKFHAENTYFICLDGQLLLGMVAVRAQRPFSLDAKLPNLDSYLPQGRSLCEVRLLAVEQERRRGGVLAGLVRQLAAHFVAHGFDCALISGTTRQLGLYRHLGFKPFGPLVGGEGAQYQPMCCVVEDFLERAESLYSVWGEAAPESFSFLPGPVAIGRDVRRALGAPPVSHRSAAFMADIQAIKARLCRLAHARHVELLLGSGTLANDVVGSQLVLEDAPGLILSNGEFGERLVEHAQRLGLRFETHAVPWGEAFDLDAVERRLQGTAAPRWLWAVHCETSTAFLNDLAALKTVCARHAVRLCLDCNSSLGNAPVDLDGVYLAAGVSGKGLGAFPGLALVFYDHEVATAPRRLPRYLDLGLYAAEDGVPFTHSSNLVAALGEALTRFDNTDRLAALTALTAWVRGEIRAVGLRLVAPDAHAAPAIVTIALPAQLPAVAIGERLDRQGFLLSYRSRYLRERNWIQISLMGECRRERVASLLDALGKLAREAAPPAAAARSA